MFGINRKLIKHSVTLKYLNEQLTINETHNKTVYKKSLQLLN